MRASLHLPRRVAIGRSEPHDLAVDPILRTALDWFVEETHSSAPLTEIHRALRELRVKIDKLPSRLFYLDSPDEPYALPEILTAMGKHALIWQQDPETATERKLLAPQVEEILQKAIDLREVLAKVSKNARNELMPRLPQGEVRRSMEHRSELLPDRR
jgi:hypothetical protein